MSDSPVTAASLNPDAAGPVIAPRRNRQERKRCRRQSNVFILNLTPLLDCVFLLLMFLIVATRFSNPEGLLQAKLPARTAVAVPGTEVPRLPIRVYLTATGTGPGLCSMHINQQDGPPIPLSEALNQFNQLRSRIGHDERTPVHLFIDEKVSWDDVVNVYNAALGSTFQRIYFIRPPSE